MGFFFSHHVAFVAVLFLSCLVQVTYITSAYFLLLAFHAVGHRHVVSPMLRGIAPSTTVTPLVSVCVITAIISVCACLAMAVVNIGHPVSSTVQTWYTDHEKLLRDIGVVTYHDLSRFFRYLFPNVAVAIVSFMRLCGPSPEASITSFALLQSDLSITRTPSSSDFADDSGYRASQRDHLIGSSKATSTSPILLFLLCVLCGCVAVAWPSYLTIPVLFVFLASTLMWSMGRRHRLLIPPRLVRWATHGIFLWCFFTLAAHYAMRLPVAKGLYTGEHSGSIARIGFLWVVDWVEPIHSGGGKERRYLVHLLLVFILALLAWWIAQSLCIEFSQTELEELALQTYECQGASGAADEEAGPSQPPPGSLLPAPEQVNAPQGSDRSPIRDMDETCEEGNDTEPDATSLHPYTAPPPSIPERSHSVTMDHNASAPPCNNSALELETKSVMSMVVGSEAMQAVVRQITAVKSSTLLILKKIRRTLIRISPHLLVFVLGFTATVDPSFLSAIWLIMFFVLLYYSLIGNLQTLICFLPGALIWSCLHVSAVFVANIPQIWQVSKSTQDKLTAVGLAQHDDDVVSLVLGAHMCLVLLIGTVYHVNRDSAIRSATASMTSLLGSDTTGRFHAIKEYMLERAQYVSLLLLVAVGCLQVDLVQALFVLIFVIFAASASVARRYWVLLVVYEVMATCTLYIYTVATRGFGTPSHIGELSMEVLIQRPFGSTWELVPYLVLCFFSVWQLHLFRTVSSDHESSRTDTPWTHRVKTTVSLILAWLGLMLVFSLSSISLMSTGYFALFLWVSAFAALPTGTHKGKISLACIVTMVYSALCFLSLYLFQFDSLRDIFADIANTILVCNEPDGTPIDIPAPDIALAPSNMTAWDKTKTQCVAQVGFEEYEKVHQRVFALLPHWAIFAVVLYQLQKLATPIATGAETAPSALYQRILGIGQRIRRLVTVVMPSALLLSLWLASATERSLLSGGFFIIMMIHVFIKRPLPFLVAIYSATVIAGKLVYQFKFFNIVDIQNMAYFGLNKLPTTWACENIKKEENCITVSGCMWDAEGGCRAESDKTIRAIVAIWSELLVFCIVLVHRRRTLWAKEKHGADFAEYLSMETIFNHKASAFRRDRTSGPIPYGVDLASGGDESNSTEHSPPESVASPTNLAANIPAAFNRPALRRRWRQHLASSSTAVAVNSMVTRIQAAWRGYMVRKRIRQPVEVRTLEHARLHLPRNTVMAVVAATYTSDEHLIDVTPIVRKQLHCYGLSFIVDDHLLRWRLGETSSKKVLNVTYVPTLRRATGTFRAVWDDVVIGFRSAYRAVRPYAKRFVSFLLQKTAEVIDFGTQRYGFEFLLIGLLTVAVARPYIIHSLVYTALLVVLRHMQRGGITENAHLLKLVIGACCVLYAEQQFFFIGMPPNHRSWGPFDQQYNPDNTGSKYWRYFGAYPERVDLFAGFAVFFLSVWLQHNMKSLEAGPRWPDLYKGCYTLKRYLMLPSSADTDEPIVRTVKKMRTEQRSFLEMELYLPAPPINNFITTPKTYSEYFLGYYYRCLPYACLILVFIDGSAAEFVTVLRMGKLALALWLFRLWDELEWDGNFVWRHINAYYLTVMMIHLVWNIPALADSWTSEHSIAQLYSFVGIIECRYYGNDPQCIGELVQVNSFEVIIMVLLYLQRMNFDKFEHIFILHQTYREVLFSNTNREIIQKERRRLKERGLERARDAVEERRRILDRTRQELLIVSEGANKNLRQRRKRDVNFPPVAIFDDDTLGAKERVRRRALREAMIQGLLCDANAPVPMEYMISEKRLKQLQREYFQKGQEYIIEVPKGHDMESFYSGLLSGPSAPSPDEEAVGKPTVDAFQAGQRMCRRMLADRSELDTTYSATTSRYVTPEGSMIEEEEKEEKTNEILASIIVAVAIAADLAAEAPSSTFMVRVALKLHRNTWLGNKSLRAVEVVKHTRKYFWNGLKLFVKQHSDLICYAAFCINYVMSVSLLDLFPALSTFIYALLAHPRPAPFYWELLLGYMQFILCIKCILQGVDVTFDNIPSRLTNIMGISGQQSFFLNVIGDFAVVVAILFHRQVLLSWGLYTTIRDEDEDVATEHYDDHDFGDHATYNTHAMEEKSAVDTHLPSMSMSMKPSATPSQAPQTPTTDEPTAFRRLLQRKKTALHAMALMTKKNRSGTATSSVFRQYLTPPPRHDSAVSSGQTGTSTSLVSSLQDEDEVTFHEDGIDEQPKPSVKELRPLRSNLKQNVTPSPTAASSVADVPRTVSIPDGEVPTRASSLRRPSTSPPPMDHRHAMIQENPPRDDLRRNPETSPVPSTNLDTTLQILETDKFDNPADTQHDAQHQLGKSANEYHITIGSDGASVLSQHQEDTHHATPDRPETEVEPRNYEGTHRTRKPPGFFESLCGGVRRGVMQVLDEHSKAGRAKDLYIYSFALDMLCFVLYLFVFAYLGNNKNFDLGDAIAQNLLPGGLVLGLIIMFVAMIIDRIIYLKSHLLSKFVFQILMALTVHIGYFAWWHIYEDNTNDSSAHASGSILFLFKCGWLAVSAIQIDSGFPEVRNHDCFTSKEDWITYYTYVILRAIPFVWELRMLLDWACARTTLKLNYWLKLEDLRNETYVRKMDIIDSKETNPVAGTEYPLRFKCSTGWLLVLVISVIIFFPLLYYSTFSPALTVNSVRQISVGVSFDGTPSFYESEYLVPSDLQDTQGGLAGELEATRPNLRQYSMQSSLKNLQLLSFTSFSTRVYPATPPAVAALSATLEDPRATPPGIVLSMEVQRTAGPASSLTLRRYIKYNLDTMELRRNLSKLLLWEINPDNSSVPAPVLLPQFYQPFLLNKPTSLNSVSSFSDCNLAVNATRTTTGEVKRYFSLECSPLFACGNRPSMSARREWECFQGNGTCPDYDNGVGKCPRTDRAEYVPLYYAVISDLAATTDNPLAGFLDVGIVALYVGFVMAVGRLIRTAITGSAGNAIIADMADPSFVGRLADHVHLARWEGDLRLEERLYLHLINLLRSPEALIRITGLRQPPPDLADDES